MKQPLLFLCLALLICRANAQSSSDSLAETEGRAAADDPSQFFTRTEIFNDLQHYDKDFSINQTVLRTIVKFGKRFTTRLDLPYVYNSVPNNADFRRSGLGDITFRLLGYRIFQTMKSAMTASFEFSLNTAQSPILGTGKNLFIPLITYSTMLKEKKVLLALAFQQVNSFSGDPGRKDISFSKIQVVLINTWSKRMWTVLAPEWYADYINGGLSMNLAGRIAFAPAPRINLWAQTGAGIFGDFVGRYQWEVQVGFRYFYLRKMNFKKNA